MSEEGKVIPNIIEGVKREKLAIEIEKLCRIEGYLENIIVCIGQCDISEKVEIKKDLRDILLKILNIQHSNKSKNEKRSKEMSIVTVGDRVAFNYDGLGGSRTKNLLGSGTVYKVAQVGTYSDGISVIDISIDVDRDLIPSVGKLRTTYGIEGVRVVSTQ